MEEAVHTGIREELDYTTFGVAARSLAQRVVDDDYEPDWIVAIARGGLMIAGAVGYALSIKNIATINVEFYTGVGSRRENPEILPPVLNLVDLNNTKVLVVDDVADTGETLKLVVELLRTTCAEVRSMVIYEKSWSSIAPDYTWKHTDEWINFPWSSEPALRSPRPNPTFHDGP